MAISTILRRALTVVALLVLLASIAPLQAAPPSQAAVAGELLVQLQPNANPDSLEARGLKKRDQIAGQSIYRYSITDGSDPQTKASSLAGQAGVANAEPNYRVLSPWAQKRVTWVVGAPTDSYASQWALERIGAASAQTVSRGRGVTVAVLDTGVDLSHPALAGRLEPGYDFVAGDADPREEGSAERDAGFGHGTHVAGLVALVAPEARILPLRTLRPDGSGDLWSQLVAMQYAVDNGADVINLSFSFGDRSRIFEELANTVSCSTGSSKACRASRAAGAVLVAAAGNSGESVREYPGASSSTGLLGVAASTSADQLASFSTYGSWLPLAAPGEAIISSVPGGGYATWSGTSMATPLVAGTAALVRAASPSLSPSEAARRIVDSATAIDAKVKRRVNAAAAVGAKP